MRDDASDRAIGVDSIDALNLTTRIILHLDGRTITVSWICEINPSFCIDGQIVWGVEFHLLVMVCQNLERTILTSPDQTSLSRLANDQISLLVKPEAVGSRVTKPYALLSRRRPPIDVSFTTCE